MAAKSESQPRKITLGLVLSWFFGVVFALAGFAGTVQGMFGFGIPLLLAGLILLPPVRNAIRDKFSFELSRGLLIVAVLVLMVISVVNTPGDESTSTSGSGGSLAAETPSENAAPANAGPVKCETGETVKTASACPKVLQLGDNVPAGDFTWVFANTRWEESLGSDFLREDADGIFLVVDVTVENTGTKASYLSSDMVKLVDDRGREFSPDTTAGFYMGGSALSFDRINPGIVKRGVIVYDVPEGTTFARVRITNGLFGGESHYVNLLK
jgi:hypothetical protein